MDWTKTMFAASVLGAIAGLWYPVLIHFWRKGTAALYKLDSASRLARPAQIALTVLGLFLGGGLLGLIVAAVGFGQFMGDADNAKRQTLEGLGVLSYFMAVSFGFSAASLI